MLTRLCRGLLFLCLCAVLLPHAAVVAAAQIDPPAAAADPAVALLTDLASALSHDSASTRAAALARLGNSRDVRWLPFLDDYRQGSVYRLDDQLVIVSSFAATAAHSDPVGVPLHALTRAPLRSAVAKRAVQELPLTRRDRTAAQDAAICLSVRHPDAKLRYEAVVKAGDQGGAVFRAVLADAAVSETDPRTIRAIREGLALIDLRDGDAAARRAAADTLGAMCCTRAGDLLTAALKDADPAAQTAARSALDAVQGYQSRIGAVQTVFSGLSAGSLLILGALGLSITFGLMGVINMAHGEMLMIGAYATLLVQWLFQHHLPPTWLPAYFPIGLVAGFFAAAAVGWLIEWLVVRHLYARPLDSLLATWGISLVLIQSVRIAFGDNQSVTAPSYLVGGWEALPDLVLPWNRLFIIAVTVVAMIGVVALMRGTRLGLLLRATTQSRRTAAALGVHTRRIDGLTFAFGSGLAGMAGCAMTLIGGLKPDMGQEFIIDSFLVVATGGVGNLAGVVCAGLGLGMANKLLEPFTQAVYAKVLVLGLVILFLQWRSQGLFPPRGRLADA